MMDAALVARAMLLIRSGQLPRERSDCFGGPSAGRECFVCESPIARGTMEIEIQWLGRDDWQSVAVHVHCERAWRAAVAAASTPRE